MNELHLRTARCIGVSAGRDGSCPVEELSEAARFEGGDDAFKSASNAALLPPATA